MKFSSFYEFKKEKLPRQLYEEIRYVSGYQASGNLLVMRGLGLCQCQHIWLFYGRCIKVIRSNDFDAYI